ncbi:hypothetical protein GRJ2_001247000 [Grus japonensis]|uniref:Uncharacterized protein n=1 Tax=Grus japonensis TaxID=30415 RepID=A0ABC9WRT2_GRUJA
MLRALVYAVSSQAEERRQLRRLRRYLPGSHGGPHPAGTLVVEGELHHGLDFLSRWSDYGSRNGKGRKKNEQTQRSLQDTSFLT